MKQITSIIKLSLKHKNRLPNILAILNNHQLNIRDSPVEYENGKFSILCSSNINNENLIGIHDKLRTHCENAVLTPQFYKDDKNVKMPWFPLNALELYQFCNTILGCSDNIDPNHPGASDTDYIERRKYIVGKSLNHKPLTRLPYIEYTAEETNTWRTVFNNLTKLHASHACNEYQKEFQLLVEQCGYGPNKIPQLEEVSNFLKNRTGFTLYPTAGFLSPRNFLASLAFRVFRSTQYIRHSSVPMFTPEPDVCHELIGHAPMFANASFAEFSHEMGMASLGASDEYIDKLAACYWFSVEFGICRQNGLKAYGAGLLSSYGELEYCLTDKPIYREFEPIDAADQDYKLDQYQPIYYIADSFADATDKLRIYAASIPKLFKLHYNERTDEIDIIE